MDERVCFLSRPSDAEHKLAVLQKDLPQRQLKDSSQGLLPLPTIYQTASPLLNIAASSQTAEAANDSTSLRPVYSLNTKFYWIINMEKNQQDKQC